MLPPVNLALLDQNPKFKALYKDLTTNKLNTDCTTKDLKKQRIQEGLSNVCSCIWHQLGGTRLTPFSNSPKHASKQQSDPY
ncbi:hypothetical protein EJ05DRAFT_474418 [Pseudovirgaria hyperparasitica]|uniref:Uncharacterized protein n=1 Tax=Pseudovirgaria hyperparasitica TaxID=470096 RepID=A0A6A6WEU7_9PEZI|nr:uncharacterized protein EJ05DRAFT_474418 [Pseudovirgaria hyperparasitica]KAF2760554.1 hypothetical protein EJ05DRAFT_474418 [Pseudovirgaria hyperparasitica]